MSRLPFEDQKDAGAVGRQDRSKATEDKAHKTLASVLGVFSEWRRDAPTTTNIAEIIGTIAQREVQTAHVMKDMHESLHESDQLLVYQFFLTAVHRNASIASQFAPSIMSSPERQAAMWAEYENVSSELDQLVLRVSEIGVPKPGVAAELLAADFLWSMAWWIHTRRDVMAFLPLSTTSNAYAIWALGRAPDPQDQVGSGVYEYAATSEASYRNARNNDFEDSNTPTRERESRIAMQRRQGLQNSNHM